MDNILLTIVMPFFNRKELVGEMLKSILSNDFQDYELLAIDDGSTKDTIDYVEEFARQYKQIRIITRTEMPKSAQTCRNIGIREAKGKYLVFFDSDDYITPYCLSTRVNYMEKRPDLDFIVFPSGTYYDNQYHAEASKYSFGYPIYKDDLKAFCKRTLPFIVFNNIYRTKSIREKNVLWDTNLKVLQDCDFNVQTIIKGLKYIYADTLPDYGYRIEDRGNAVSANIQTRKNYGSHLYSFEKMFSNIQQKYGHKYDYDIYNGILLIFNRVMTSGIDFKYASELTNVIKKYNRFYGFLFGLRLHCCHILSYITTPRLSRQIPFSIFIINVLNAENKKQKKIKSKIENIAKHEKAINNNCNVQL